MFQDKSVKRGDGALQMLRPFRRFLEDDSIREIRMHRAGEVWLLSFKGTVKQEVPELTESHMKSLIAAIATYNEVAVSSIMYLELPGGERCTVVLPPAIINGQMSFVIRKHSLTIKSLEELSAEGCFSLCEDVSFNRPEHDKAMQFLDKTDFTRLADFEVNLLRLKRENNWVEFFKQAVLVERNIVIAGKTGSGKTTFGRSLLEIIPTTQHIVTLEDVHELILKSHPSVTHLIYGTGPGRVSPDDGIRACMRISPDRICLSELRGSEALEYLDSLESGHPGSITTTHANSALQVFDRITSLIKKSDVGKTIDKEDVKDLLYRTIDITVFMKERKILEVFYDPIFAKSKKPA